MLLKKTEKLVSREAEHDGLPAITNWPNKQWRTREEDQAEQEDRQVGQLKLPQLVRSEVVGTAPSGHRCQCYIKMEGSKGTIGRGLNCRGI